MTGRMLFQDCAVFQEDPLVAGDPLGYVGGIRKLTGSVFMNFNQDVGNRDELEMVAQAYKQIGVETDIQIFIK